MLKQIDNAIRRENVKRTPSNNKIWTQGDLNSFLQVNNGAHDPELRFCPTPPGPIE